MSIILKALKKAEALTHRKNAKADSQVFTDTAGKKIGTIVAVVAVSGLLLFFMTYLIYSKKASRTFSPQAVNTQGQPHETPKDIKEVPAKNIQKEAPAKAVPVIDTDRFNADAVKAIRAKDFQTAEKILREAARVNPADPVLLNHLGLALKNQRLYKEASEAYAKAIGLKADYPEAMNNLAIVYEILGDTGKAKNLYKKALSVKPSYAEAHLNYAILLEAMGNNSEAESHYHTFMNISTDEALKVRVKERLKWLKNSR